MELAIWLREWVAKVLRLLAAIGSLSIAFQESTEVVKCLDAWMEGRTDRWTDTQINTWIDIARSK